MEPPTHKFLGQEFTNTHVYGVCSNRKSFMFSDPQTITVNAIAQTLPRVSAGEYNGLFRTADGGFVLSIKHTTGKRDRSVVRLDQRKICANPLDPAKNLPYTASVYLVLDAPPGFTGFTSVELENATKALTAYLSAANVTKFVGKES